MVGGVVMEEEHFLEKMLLRWTDQPAMLQGGLQSQLLKQGWQGASLYRYESNKIMSLSSFLQLSYAIGYPEPLSITVFTYGTGKKSDDELVTIIRSNFDLRPGCIIRYHTIIFAHAHLVFKRDLKLKRPIFQKTAAYGHFGREDDPDFTWEKPKKLKI